MDTPAGMAIETVTLEAARPSPPQRVHHSCLTMPLAPHAGQGMSHFMPLPAPERTHMPSIRMITWGLLVVSTAPRYRLFMHRLNKDWALQTILALL